MVREGEALLLAGVHSVDVAASGETRETGGTNYHSLTGLLIILALKMIPQNFKDFLHLNERRNQKCLHRVGNATVSSFIVKCILKYST